VYIVNGKRRRRRLTQSYVLPRCGHYPVISGRTGRYRARVDIGIEAAGITLISGSLAGVVTALSLSRSTIRNIRQNLFFALAYNGIEITVAAV
jgi:hypothetical protein